MSKKSFGLKAKITFFVIFIVAGVLIISGYLDYHFSKKDQINLYLDRTLYIAKQIDVGIPDQKILSLRPRLYEEMEEWLLSRSFLVEIDIFLFTAKGWEPFVSISKLNVPKTSLSISNEQIKLLKRDRHFSSFPDLEGEKRLEVIVPLHSGKNVIGGIRLLSSLNEAKNYLSKKRERAFILTCLSIITILITLTLLYGKLVGNPIQKLVEAMSKAEKGNLETEVHLQSQDELGELGRHFNRMLKTIKEANQQNIRLLSQVNQFNEELTRRIEEATSELAKRNEELRLLNEALFETQRQLAQSEKLVALGQVTAMMAHQIGTPLNSISGYIQLMRQEGNFSSTDQERLRIIESQLDRLADSIKSILSFTRQPKPNLIPLDVNEILRELIQISEPWLSSRNVKLSSSLSPGLPKVLGDATHLQTVFLNLITNALDAMPNGGSLSIKTQEALSSSSEDGNWLEISFADSGIGITDESKKRIFDPFFSTKKIGEGTGLGLAICQKIIQEHSGKMEVESEVGKGSTFFVFLPIPQGKEIYG